MSTIKETTTIDQLDLDLDAILTGADNIMLPEKEKKPNMFSKPAVDLSVLEEREEPEDKDTGTLTEVLEEIDPADASIAKEKTTDEGAGKGRPKVDKSGTAELMKKLIDAGKLIPFEDDKPLEEYTLKDYEELIEANFQEKERAIKENTPKEFFEALPEELQIAAQYVASGGSDLKGLFRALSQVEENRQLDINNESDAERIVREYLSATQFGTPDEIEEEIEIWKDREEITQKAKKFKPKLDAMHEQQVQYKLAEQERLKQQQQEQAQRYVNSVYEALKPGDLNGVKLDKKTQEFLYAGLIQPSYPSVSGRKTNMLGHLLEKYQYVEPNHSLIAEALWLLSDPEGYRKKIKEQGESVAAEKTARMLKTEQSRNSGGSAQPIEQEDTGKKGIPRNQNIFKRF